MKHRMCVTAALASKITGITFRRVPGEHCTACARTLTFPHVLAAREHNCQKTTRARQAVEKSLPLLQSSARIWFQNRKCAFCHDESGEILSRELLNVGCHSNGRETDWQTAGTYETVLIGRRANSGHDR